MEQATVTEVRVDGFYALDVRVGVFVHQAWLRRWTGSRYVVIGYTRSFTYSRLMRHTEAMWVMRYRFPCV